MTSLIEIESALHDECHQLESKLNDMKSDKQLETCPDKPKTPEDIRKYNLKALRNELSLMDRFTPIEPVTNPLVVADNLLSKLSGDIEGSKSFVDIIKKDVEKLQSEVEEKSVFLREQKQIFKQLEEDVAKLDGVSEQEDLASVEDVVKSTTKTRQDNLRKMFAFLDEHFPTVKEGSTKFLSLRCIIEKLLATNPEKPYIVIEPDFWPPHVEVLLRFSICIRHPDNPILIRLFYDGD